MATTAWVLQQQGYELGNFMMMTPALRIACDQQGPVPVFFETKSLVKLFRDCPFLRRVKERPQGSPRCTSKPPREDGSDNVTRFIKSLCKTVPEKTPDYYVDSRITYHLKPSSKRRIAIVHGCLGRYWQPHKTLPKLVRQHMLDVVITAGLQPVLLGNGDDARKFWAPIEIADVENYLGKLSLRDTVSVLAQCDGFISNDTGLYHVAAALKKPGIVLWKKTDPKRNRAPGDSIEHFVSREGDVNAYNEAISEYIRIWQR
jgi:ADP-heptose:LPS heptosyltransferase